MEQISCLGFSRYLDFCTRISLLGVTLLVRFVVVLLLVASLLPVGMFVMLRRNETVAVIPVRLVFQTPGSSPSLRVDYCLKQQSLSQ